MITVQHNSVALTIREKFTLAELLETLGYKPNTFAVSVNETFIARVQYKLVELKEGDRIDVVSAMPGG